MRSRDRDEQLLTGIDWTRLETAYGPANAVPSLILEFLYSGEQRAAKAGYELQDHLCHQYTRVSSATEPAAPFIMPALTRPEPLVLESALDLLRGFAWGTEPIRNDLRPWHRELRALVLQQLPRVRELTRHEAEEVRDTAELFLEEVAEQDSRA